MQIQLTLVTLAFQRSLVSSFLPRTSCSRAMGRLASSAINQVDLPQLESTAKRIFWVRHGEVINPGGDRPVYYGAMDVPLSDLGRLEAQAAAGFLKSFSLQRVFCSPLERAIYGAKQVIEKQEEDLNPDPLILEGFKELDRGDWCGKTKTEIGKDLMARFDACDLDVTPENGESYPALKDRVIDAREKALDELKPGQQGAVVSHLQVTRCVLSDAEGIPTDEMSTLPIATASITCIDYYDDSKQVVHFSSFKPEVGLATSKDGAN